MASIANRQSLLVARDELELVGGQNAGFCYPAPNSAFVLNGNAHQHHFHPNFLHPDLHQPLGPAEGGNGPLSTIRRSLRQMNPFKSRLFRLPATPRLSRSKKVLGRGEDFTGWNFERPGQNNNGSTQSSASNSLRPLSSSSFGPVDFEYRPGNGCGQNDQNGHGHYFQRRFSNVDGGYGPPATQFPPSPIFQRRTVISNVGCDCCEQIEQNGAMEGGDGDSEGIGDLDEFLDAMESISKRGQIGGSCRVMTAAQKREEMLWNGRCQGKGGTVAGGPLPPTMAIGSESGTKRNRRPPIPSFNPPGWPQSPSTAFPPGQMPNGRIASNGNYPPQNQRRDREESPYLQLLPSTCYSPNGEMYAARWRPGQSLMAKSGQFNGGSPQLAQRGRQRPQPLYLPGGGQLVNPQQNEPKSPSQSSTITLLNTQMMAAMGGGGGMRSASTVSSASAALIRQQQKSIRPPQPAPSIGLFPQTQLQRRRSACSASAALETGNALGNGHNRDRSIAEEEEGEERAQAASGSANYYGRDILKLMGLEQKAMGPLDSAENSPSLLPNPPLLFPMEDELFIGAEEEFIGREWLFKELCQQLLIERAKLVILMGQSGCGKSAILRQIVANSHFCAPQKIDSAHQSADQHNTVDSGIAISGGGGNSSGSQLSLLNISLAPPPPFADPIASPSSSSLCPPQNRCPSPTPSNGRNYEWLRTLGRQICAFHFAHLHDANSCALPEFIRSICAQFCRCPQIKQNYGKMIRSNPNLHRLATQESAALCLDPMELFRQLILHPIGQLYAEEEQRKRKGAAKRCASKVSDYGGSNFDSSDRNPLPSPSPLPPSILVCIDGLDEAGFHRTDGGESIGWLLRRSLPEWPPQLRFVASLAPGPGSLCEQNSIFGTLAEGEKPLEARTIRLDDWELDERIGRDARLFVEAKVHQSPALEKWVSGQFRRQSFFAASSSPPSPHPFQIAHQANLGEFAAQLAQHCRANYPILQLSLAMLAEGRVLSLGNLPADIGQLYALHFRHKFQCASRFEPISQILSILLASLHPLDFDQLLAVLNAAEGEKGRRIGADELRQRMAQLAPLICQLPHSGRLIPFHASLREWLLKEAGSTEFGIDIRQGHILLAHSLLNSPASPHPGHFFELAHHLLKANPHKYMRPELAAKLGMPQGRDAQIQWLKRGAEGSGKRTATPISNSLLFQRNVFYPNSKVSRLLLLAGADPNASNWPNGIDQSSLLCAFSRAGNAEMIQMLLQFGANPNFGSPSPLILAIQNGHESVARLLCANGADLTAKDAEGRGPLWHSAANDSLAMLGFLLDTFGDAEGKSGKRTEKLEENGGNGRNEGQNRQQYSSACSSAAGGYEEEIMQQNERPMQREKGNMAQNRLDRNEAIREAFECAAERGSVRICRFLLDCTDALLDTSRAMCIACANGRSEVVQFLLSRGATLAPDQTWNGKSALICAVESGSWDLVVNVLNGASQSGMGELNAVRGPDRLSPLMVAARHGHVGLVDLLVNRGAHLDAADAHGRTAAMHAIEAGHTSTVGLLLERGCSIQARDGHGNTMLHLLGRHPRKCLINRLLEAGLSLEDKNREDLRPIEVAIQCGQLAAVDAFLRRGARLRSLTWQIALASHPPLILVLLRKLLDDAQILLRRKRPVEAQHRLKYAQQKCEEMLGMAEEGANPREALRAIRPQLRRYKIQSLLAMASLKRKANNLLEAISLASQALEMLDTDLGMRVRVEEEGAECSTASSNSEAEEDGEGEEEEGLFRFDLHLLRAKCHFDARDLAKARVDAQMAARLRPMDQEAKSLLAILGTGWGQIR